MEENALNPVYEDRVDVETTKSEDVCLSEKGRKYFSQTRPWVRFLSIILFICIGCMVLGGLMILLVGMTGSLLGSSNPIYDMMPGGTFVVGLVYIILAILYAAPAVFLSRYASAIKNLQAEPSSQVLEGAIKYQKSFWRYIGVLTVVSLVIMAAAIAFFFAIVFFMFLNR